MKTATRILDVFEIFAREGRPLSLSQLADELNAPVSSCFGLVKALQQRGYLYSAGSRKEMYPTRRMLVHAQQISAHEPVTARFGEILDDLRDATGETVILGQLSANGAGVIYLDVLEGTHTIRYSAGIGEIKPLHASAIGKALLGALPADKAAKLIRKARMERATDRTLTTAAKLEADIEEGRRRGYQMTRGEHVADVAAIAVPLHAFDRDFAVAIAGPIQRIDEMRQAYASKLLATVEKLQKLK